VQDQQKLRVIGVQTYAKGLMEMLIHSLKISGLNHGYISKQVL
jgi:hypothetical protein